MPYMRDLQFQYEVNEFGQPVSVVPAGGYVRGKLIRASSVHFRPSTRDLVMLDPTNPLTWNQPGFQ